MDARYFLLMVSCVICVFLCSCSESSNSVSNTTYIENITLYPNPFKDSVIIGYSISGRSATKIVLDLFSDNGQKIQTYTFPSNDSTAISVFRTSSYPYNSGYSECWWNGSSLFGNVPNGVYYFNLALYESENLLSKKSGTILRAL